MGKRTTFYAAIALAEATALVSQGLSTTELRNSRKKSRLSRMQRQVRLHPITKELITMFIDKNGNEYLYLNEKLIPLKYLEHPFYTKCSIQSGREERIAATATKRNP